MTGLDCDHVRAIAPEFALDCLPGDERAGVIAHLDDCAACQDAVSSLAAVSDRLLLLAPPAEPPQGFAERVVNALAPPNPDVSPAAAVPARRGGVVALVVAASIAFVVLAVGFGGPAAPPALAGAPMRSTSGEVVGQVFTHRETPSVLFMDLHGWSQPLDGDAWGRGPYSVRVERVDGDVHTYPMEANGTGLWAVRLGDDHDPVTSVAVVDSYGYVWCEGELEPAS